MAVRAARSVSRQFDPISGLIPLGAEAEEAHTVGDGEANIDGMMAVPLLLWAARHCDDDELRKVALSHAYKSEEFFIRPDGGVVQSASFDTKTGDVVRRYTHKGFSDTSIWTRAQGWAMLTFAIAASQERDERNLLRIAEKVANWWLAHIPDDLVAYWDFDAPVTAETRRDTSGTAIAASALLKLAAIHPDNAKAARYAATGRETARALVQHHLTSKGILANGCFDPKNNKAVANELIWGDYQLMETIARLSGKLAVGL
jgi:unsaturated chondroitin disaccharide hydrolase